MLIKTKIGSIVAAGTVALTAAGGFAGAASAQESPLSGITSCSAPGGQQTTGALLGAVLGAVAGDSLSKGDKTAGVALGALVGGAAGSWMGCKVQRDRLDARYSGYAEAREDLVRHPAAYRRARAEQRFREQQAADYRAWRAREETRYGYAEPGYAPANYAYDGYGY